MERITRTTTIVLITGANQGIGLEIARNLSTPSLYPDHHVIIGSRHLAKGEAAGDELLKQDPTRSISAISIDLNSDASIAAAAATILKAFGRIDVLINNAGIMGEPPAKTSTSRPEMQKMFDTNLFGTAAVTEAFIPLLENSTQRNPRIVFLSSQLASLGTKAGGVHPSCARNFPAYRCSKAALNMLMLHYAAVYGNRGWKINAADPGLTKTYLGGEVMKQIMGSGVPGTVEDGAKEACRLATLGADGENGTYSSKEGVRPW